MILATNKKEVLAFIGFCHFLIIQKECSLSKSLLFLPFVLHEPTLRILTDGRINSRSLDEVIMKNPLIMSGFNDRYTDYLSTSLNVLTLMHEAELITVVGESIVLRNENSILEFISKIPKGGKMARLKLASNSLHYLLVNNDIELYSKLRIQI